MSGNASSAPRPDLAQGIALDDIADGAMIEGRVGDEAVLLVRRGDALFAVGAQCPHYGAPLAQGLLVGDTLRCPWHHAAFCLRSGARLRAPALDGLKCWRVERRDGRAVVVDARASAPSPAPIEAPESIVIVGGGAAAISAAVTLRDEGYTRAITLLSADDEPPYDRPNLSKDYLAGTAEATGCRCARRRSTRTGRSTCAAARASHASMPRSVRSSSRTAAGSATVRCCSRRAPYRTG